MMEKYFLKPLKNAARWYFRRSSESIAWLPSGMIPYNYSK